MQSTQCMTCKHYQGLGKCEAFPESIPRKILDGRFDHRNPHKGDNGIQYEPEASLAGATTPFDEAEE